MNHEYEIVRHSKFQNLHVLIVEMGSRTPHLHRDLELGLVLEGTLDILCSDHTEHLEAGNLYLINALEMHAFHAIEHNVKILAIQTSYKIMNSFLTKPIIPRFPENPALHKMLSADSSTYRLLRTLCLDLAAGYLTESADAFHTFFLLSKLQYLLIQDLPHSILSDADYQLMKKKPDRLLSILDYIDANFQRKLLLDEIANREGFTLSYMSHFFKDSTGMSFQAYLKEKRFEKACRLLLTTDWKLLDISLNCGFSDIRFMTEVFREKTGLTPKEYRNANHHSIIQNQTVSQTFERILPPAEAGSVLKKYRSKSDFFENAILDPG